MKAAAAIRHTRGDGGTITRIDGGKGRLPFQKFGQRREEGHLLPHHLTQRLCHAACFRWAAHLGCSRAAVLVSVIHPEITLCFEFCGHERSLFGVLKKAEDPKHLAAAVCRTAKEVPRGHGTGLLGNNGPASSDEL